MVEKWSINRLSDETGKDRRTIKKILASVNPLDEVKGDPVYALRDFMEAWFAHEWPLGKALSHNLEAEKTRLTAAQADIAELERAERRNQVLDVEVVFAVFENIALGWRRTILTSSLDEQQKDRLLAELQAVTIADFLEQKEFTHGQPTEET